MKSVEIGGKVYGSLPIQVAIDYAHEINFSFFIRLSEEKFVQISHDDGEFLNKLKKYKKKGLTDILVEEAIFLDFLAVIRNALRNKFFNPSTLSTEDKMRSLSSAYTMVKRSLVAFGINKQAVDLAIEVNQKAMDVVKMSPNIFDLLSKFRHKCDEAFIVNLTVSFTASCMIDRFYWKSNQIKEKVTLGILLSDLTLHKNDFNRLKEWHETRRLVSELPDKIKMHPHIVADMVSKAGHLLSKETIEVIKHHHELPDGSGYPDGLAYQRIPLLSAVHIVARRFVELLIDCQFDFNKRDEIVAELDRLFFEGAFEQSVCTIYEMLGLKSA